MIYLAILLILCGLLILITALSVETGITSTGEEPAAGRMNKPAGSLSGDVESEDVEIIYPGDNIHDAGENKYEEDIFISFDDEPGDLDNLDLLPEISYKETPKETPKTENIDVDHKKETFHNERRKLDSTGRPAIIEKRMNPASPQKYYDETVFAVMYDDRSNIIDYETGSGVIDSTFAKYKSIKRIGRGRVESDFDGINFFLDDKLYRFDFHKVYDIWSGPGYVALPLKGNSTVKLFLIENSPGFPEKVETNFKEYEKGL